MSGGSSESLLPLFVYFANSDDVSSCVALSDVALTSTSERHARPLTAQRVAQIKTTPGIKKAPFVVFFPFSKVFSLFIFVVYLLQEATWLCLLFC